MKYHKIITVWERDPGNNFKTLVEGRWATPEIAMLANCEWECTEKVNGTNIRITLDEIGSIALAGKTDNSQIPAPLLSRLHAIGNAAYESGAVSMTLHGEGYGDKIQKGGSNYKADGVDFVLFDVWCGGVWLKREDVQDIGNTLGIACVPVIMCTNLRTAIRSVRRGVVSRWGNFQAEGLVMRPLTELQNRRGQRIITKIKARDFA